MLWVGSRHLHCLFRHSWELWKVPISLADQGGSDRSGSRPSTCGGRREEEVRAVFSDSIEPLIIPLADFRVHMLTQ